MTVKSIAQLTLAAEPVEVSLKTLLLFSWVAVHSYLDTVGVELSVSCRAGCVIVNVTEDVSGTTVGSVTVSAEEGELFIVLDIFFRSSCTSCKLHE